MTIESGIRLGPYEIVSPIGAGGMGEVWRARDTRLDRDVAIKVLPPGLAGNELFLQRFEREAKAISQLNHSHVCTLYDVGASSPDGSAKVHYLVMELLEGESLADRVKKGPLPLHDVLKFGRQIASALDAAHRQGITHRDLKPGNIMLTKSGAKLLDFGLAKTATEGKAPIDGMTNMPTAAKPLTTEGTILGTFQYMAPEQLEGLEADARTDIFALGAVLYEMATGRRAFQGQSKTSLIAAIVSSQPEPISSVAPMAPPALDHVVRRCLEKDPDDRWQSAHDVAGELQWISEAGSQAGVATPITIRRKTRERLAWTLAAVGLIAAPVLAWIALRTPRPVPSPTRFEIAQPDGFFMYTDGTSARLSPDGRSLAFLAADSTGTPRIWLRPLETTVATPIAGTDNVYNYIFWSPDGRQIAFVSDDKLKKIAVTGGEAEVVCAVKAFRGGTWNRDGMILIAPVSNGPIYRVPATGGEPQPVTTLDSTRGETAHRFPQFLPDGRHFLFSALPARDGKFEIHVGSIDSSERRGLLSADTGVTLAPGHLLYARDGKLIAQGFDANALELRGDPVPLGDAVTGTEASGGPIASASATGSIAYVTYQQTDQRLAWVDFSGREIAQIPIEPGPYSLPSLSPDDRRVVLSRTESPGASDLWIADLERGVVTRFTDDPGDIDATAWSPDGTRIAYMWSDNSPQVLKVKSLAGNTVETFLDSDPLFKNFHGWTRDGHSIIYSRLDPQTQWDLWVLPLDGDRTPRAYLNTRFNELGAALSNDGRWMSYRSDESGRFEAYVQSFPVPGGKYQVTTGGANWVGWSPDGRHLAYGLSSDPLQGLEAELQGGSEFRLGPAREFITFPKDARGVWTDQAWKRLIALLPAGKDPTPSITVVLNALPEGPR